MEYTDILLWLGTAIFILVGIVGLFVPALPGPSFLLIGFVLWAWVEDFVFVGWGTIGGLIALTALAFILDFIAGALGAKKSGASSRATFGAIVGAIVGIFFGFIGVFFGPFIGAFIGEFSVQKKSGPAAQAGLGVLLGVIIGTAAKVAIGFAMIGLFVIVRFS